MYPRAAIKQRAKSSFFANYWPLVGLFLIVSVLAGSSSGSAFRGFSNGLRIRSTDLDSALEIRKWIETYKPVILSVGVAASVIAAAYSVFVGNIIMVGAAKLGLNAYRGERVHILDIFTFFRSGKKYKNALLTMLIKDLFILIGLMLFIIPGIIVAFGLAQVEYLLADGVDRSPMEIIRMSWEIMRGRKGDYFVFTLSFIGWILLTGLTLGILGIFFTNPYISIAEAGYYDNIITFAPAE